MFSSSCRIAGLALAVLILWVPVNAHANRGHGSHDGPGFELHAIVHHARDLGLSDEQVMKFKALITDYQKSKIQGEANVKLAELDVRSLMRDDKADMAVIENAIRKSETAQSNVRIEGVKAIKTARTILTPEQLQKWRASRGTRHTQGKSDEQHGKPGQDAPKS